MATKQVIAELLVEIGVDAKDAEKAAARIKSELKKVGKAGDAADKGVTRSEKALKRFSKAGQAANTPWPGGRDGRWGAPHDRPHTCGVSTTCAQGVSGIVWFDEQGSVLTVSD